MWTLLFNVIPHAAAAAACSQQEPGLRTHRRCCRWSDYTIYQFQESNPNPKSRAQHIVSDTTSRPDANLSDVRACSCTSTSTPPSLLALPSPLELSNSSKSRTWLLLTSTHKHYSALSDGGVPALPTGVILLFAARVRFYAMFACVGRRQQQHYTHILPHNQVVADGHMDPSPSGGEWCLPSGLTHRETWYSTGSLSDVLYLALTLALVLTAFTWVAFTEAR